MWLHRDKLFGAHGAQHQIMTVNTSSIRAREPEMPRALTNYICDNDTTEGPVVARRQRDRKMKENR